MQPIHRALLQEAAGSWPLIVRIDSVRISTCDHNVNGRTFAEVVELRDFPPHQRVVDIGCKFDDLALLRQLPTIQGDGWEFSQIRDNCGESVADAFFTCLDQKTQIIVSILHQNAERLSNLVRKPLSIYTICRILAVKDNDEIRKTILSFGINLESAKICTFKLTTNAVQWILDQGASPIFFDLHALWGTDQFEQALAIESLFQISMMCDWTQYGLSVVLAVAERFPDWPMDGVLSNFINQGDEEAVKCLWNDYYKEIPDPDTMYDTDTIQWILSLCTQEQKDYLQDQPWLCADLAAAKYLDSIEFYGINLDGVILPSMMASILGCPITTVSSSASLAILDELQEMSHRFEPGLRPIKHIAIIEWITRHSNEPPVMAKLYPPTSQRQLDWFKSRYTWSVASNKWVIKKD